MGQGLAHVPKPDVRPGRRPQARHRAPAAGRRREEDPMDEVNDEQDIDAQVERETRWIAVEWWLETRAAS